MGDMKLPVSLLALACIAAAATDCAQLVKLALPQTTIEIAQTISDGSFRPPGAATPISNLPSFCRVAGTIRPSADSDIRIEVWLPSAGWNGKFQGIGNGGFAGAIGYGGLGGAVAHGYAAAATDTGHQAGGQDARWALGHPEKIIDYGWRAIHETAVKGKAITKEFYGEEPKRSYFNSCSNGGRQALMEAQRFPEDYDGIVAGAPANNFTRLLALAMVGVKATLAVPGGYIPAAKLAAIQKASLSACDARDGVSDGVIEEPLSCRPDTSALLCKGGENDACLTAPQIEALKTMYGGVRDSKGKLVFPGISHGGEADPGGWSPWITGKEPEKSSMFAFGTQFFKNMVYSDPAWDYRSFELERDLKAAEQKMGPVLNSTDPDLRRFRERGGKLIIYHGWCDAAIPAESAVAYYRSVENKVGAKKTREFVRLFMAPGVQHCAGGTGPNSFGQAGPRNGDAGKDLNAALERWVEQSVAPERVVATKYKSPGVVERTRPLCAYPLVARWAGSGSTDDAANFECAASSKR
jgi:feruloyl esterase